MTKGEDEDMKQYKVAVVGALGAVGQEMIKTLEQRKFPVAELVPLDIPANVGKTVLFHGKPVTVKAAQKGAFVGVDLALFSIGAEASLELAPVAVSEGAIVVDNSAAWRMDPDTPLVVPEVNPDALDGHKGIIANPNCSTIQMLVALKPLHDAYKIKRIVVSTYQAISGTGTPAIKELTEQAGAWVAGKPIVAKVYPRQILFNALPHIDDFLPNGYTKEEMKMVNETKKIMDPTIEVCPTAVRVPIFRGHSESVNIETERAMDVDAARELLRKAPGVKVMDDPATLTYPTPLDADGEDATFVGRIRKDPTVKNGLNLWVVSDNLRKGAALNAVQIGEVMIAKGLL
jgi:aspartate-semialdehyde dehydrogenase